MSSCLWYAIVEVMLTRDGCDCNPICGFNVRGTASSCTQPSLISSFACQRLARKSQNVLLLMCAACRLAYRGCVVKQGPPCALANAALGSVLPGSAVAQAQVSAGAMLRGEPNLSWGKSPTDSCVSKSCRQGSVPAQSDIVPNPGECSFECPRCSVPSCFHFVHHSLCPVDEGKASDLAILWQQHRSLVFVLCILV